MKTTQFPAWPCSGMAQAISGTTKRWATFSRKSGQHSPGRPTGRLGATAQLCAPRTLCCEAFELLRLPGVQKKKKIVVVVRPPFTIKISDIFGELGAVVIAAPPQKLMGALTKAPPAGRRKIFDLGVPGGGSPLPATRSRGVRKRVKMCTPGCQIRACVCACARAAFS